MSDPRDEPREAHDPVGSVGEEAAKLFGAIADLARDRGGAQAGAWGPLAAQVGRAAQDAVQDGFHEVDDHLATGSAECRWCPVCRVVHAVRETASPEVRAHLASAASSLLQAAAQMLEPPAAARPSEGSGTGRADGRDVEHIDLDGDDETDADGAGGRR